MSDDYPKDNIIDMLPILNRRNSDQPNAELNSEVRHVDSNRDGRIMREATKFYECARAYILAHRNGQDSKEFAQDFINSLSESFSITYKVLFYVKDHHPPVYPKRLREKESDDSDESMSDSYYTLEQFLSFMRYLGAIAKLKELAEVHSTKFNEEELEEICEAAYSRLHEDIFHGVQCRFEDLNGTPIEKEQRGKNWYEVPKLNSFEKAVRKELESIVRRKARLAIW